MKVLELDIIFLSYDEPNADLHYADLCSKVPWAKRVHGVKGSDAAHKAAAHHSETDWFITVDADNIVDRSFFDLDIDVDNPAIQVYGWCGRNAINGLRYGNGGLKIWKKDFVLNMKTHESAEEDRAQVDFCWEDGYQNFPKTYSESIVNGSPFQAWRAGFREGVKMTLLDGIKIDKNEVTKRIWWHNIHRLKIWSTVGSHVENGKYAILGARQGTYMTNCTDWDYVQVRDFDYLTSLYAEVVDPLHDNIDREIELLGEKLHMQMGLNWPYFSANESEYVVDLYEESINLGLTYFSNHNV